MSTSHNMLNLLETVGLHSQQVVDSLDETFPPVNPSPDMTIEQIMYRAGQRSVLEWIENRLDEES